jgi:hypothetical protein
MHLAPQYLKMVRASTRNPERAGIPALALKRISLKLNGKQQELGAGSRRYKATAWIDFSGLIWQPPKH